MNNEIVNFLIGKWECTSFEILDQKPIKKEVYKETMERVSEHVISITAHNYRDNQDLTRQMNLVLNENEIIMKQGDFVAKGVKEGNVYYLTGNYEESEFRFRLYTIGDKYVFHREVWKGGVVLQVDMSYLTRES